MPEPIDAKLDEITDRILDAAFAVHRAFGPGALESVYRLALVHALENRGLEVAQ